MKFKKIISISCSIITAMSLLAGCGSKPASEGNAETSKELILYSPHPLEFIEPLVNEYEVISEVKVEVVAAGTGELLKRIESEASNPLGDVLWGGSLTSVSSYGDYFENYLSANEEFMAEQHKNTEGFLTRFSDIPSVLMVNDNLIGDIQVNGYEDLLNPELKGKIAFADPSKSSSSFEQLINMLYAMGNGNPEDGWEYVSKLIDNLDGKLLSGSSAVYKGVADGEYTIGLTFEEGAAKFVQSGSPVSLVYMEEGVISKADGVYIIKDATNKENAQSFVDFLTSKEAQTIMSEQLNRRSVRTDVAPPSYLKSTEDINLIYDDVQYVTENKSKILEKFSDIFTSN
ncbi:MAG: ABC transporter substrate-binding protein [Lachnospirales bacterium]